MITLEKIDQVVERTGVDYTVAKEALENCNGNVIEAIIFIEKNKEAKNQKDGLKAGDILETLKEFIRRGNVSRIIVSDSENTLLNIPVTVGAIGVVLAPVIAVIGIGAAVLSNINISILDYNGELIDLNQVTADRLEFLRKKGEKVKSAAEKKAEDVKDYFSSKKETNEEECKASDEEVIIDVTDYSNEDQELPKED